MEPIKLEPRGLPRLLQIASEEGVKLDPPGPRIPRITIRPAFIRPGDVDRARQVLTDVRESALKQKAPNAVKKLFLSKSTKERYAQEEFLAALDFVIKSSESPGVAEALIDMAGNVNIARSASTSRSRKLQGGGQQDTRNEFLQAATSGRQSGMVSLLAYHSDQINKDKALEIAVSQNDTAIVEILLSYNANPNSCQNEFQAAVRHGKLEMASLLLRGSIPVEPLAVSECLSPAVAVGSFELVACLLSEGANTDHEDALALRMAVGKGRKDIAILMVLSQHPPSAANLDKVVKAAFIGFSRQESYPLVDVLLNAGARGTHCASVLIDVVKSQDYRFAQLLINHNISINHDDAAAVTYAVHNGNLPMAQLLLQGNLNPTHAASIFTQIPKLPTISPANQLTFMQLLIKSGATGDSISKALAEAVDPTEGCIKIIKLLLNEGRANVNIDGGIAICQGVKIGTLECLKALTRLSSPGPNANSVENALNKLLALPYSAETTKRLEILLEQHRPHELLELWLLREIQQSKTSLEPALDVAHTLLRNGADVDYNEGLFIQEAVRTGAIQMLALLMEYHPKNASLGTALLFATNSVSDPKELHIRTQILLRAGAHGESIQEALIVILNSTEWTWEMTQPLMKLLLSSGASVNYKRGKAVLLAVERAEVDYLKLIVNHAPSQDTLQIAITKLLFRKADVSITEKLKILLSSLADKRPLSQAVSSAWEVNRPQRYNVLELILNAAQVYPKIFFDDNMQMEIDILLVKAVNEPVLDHEMLALLLQSGASVEQENCKCILNAYKNCNYPIFKLLIGYIRAPGDISKIFEGTMSCGILWQNESRLAALTLLLEKGAVGSSVDQALVEAAINYHAFPAAKTFLTKLLAYGSNLDHADGRCLQIAAASANSELLKELLSQSPSVHSMSMAIFHIFDVDLDEKRFIELLDLFLQRPGEKPDLNFEHPTKESMLALSLKHCPQGAELLQKLLVAGCDPNLNSRFHFENDSSESVANMLIWALVQPRGAISNKIIDLLILHGANVNSFGGPDQLSPLMLAAQARRPQLVRRLLEYGADIAAVDRADRSALWYASQTGDLASMTLLLPGSDFEANGIARKNDGSLHEAARKLHVGAVKLLLKHDHDPNFPSKDHEGRSVLGEVCYGAVGTESVAQVRHVIEALIDGPTKVDLEVLDSNNKPLLFLALNNSYAVTEALLSTVMWRYIGHDWNMFNTGGYCYSPSMYVQKGIWQGPESQRAALVKILRQYRCSGSFYALEGAQPPDFKGAPPHILEAERQRRAQESVIQEHARQHKLMLAQKREVAVLNQTLSQQQHSLSISQDIERAENSMRLESNANLRRQRVAEQKRAAELEHAKLLGEQSLTMANKNNQQQLEYRRNLAMIEHASLETKRQVELKSLEAQTFAEQGRHARLLEQNADQRNTVTHQLEAQSLAEQNQHARLLEQKAAQARAEQAQHTRLLEQGVEQRKTFTHKRIEMEAAIKSSRDANRGVGHHQQQRQLQWPDEGVD